MVDLLQGGRRYSMVDLAARLGVSERTVRRDVERLQLAGVSVEVMMGRAGGVSLPPGSLLPALRFTDDEALALGLGLYLARRTGGESFERAARSASRRLSAVLGTSMRERLEALEASLVSAPAGPDPRGGPRPSVESGMVLDLAEAVRSRRSVRLDYRSFGGAFTSRRVDPYGMVRFEARWYVAGYCHLRSDIRVFRIDRIRSVQAGVENFTAPATFDAFKVVTDSIAAVPYAGTIRCMATFRCDLAVASRLVPPGAVMLEPHEDGVLVTVREEPRQLERLAMHLLALPVPITVLGPQPFREAFSAVARRAAALADGGAGG